MAKAEEKSMRGAGSAGSAACGDDASGEAGGVVKRGCGSVRASIGMGLVATMRAGDAAAPRDWAALGRAGGSAGILGALRLAPGSMGS